MARHKKTEGSRVDQINAYFVPSDAPPEEWAEDEKEWPVEGIVEEDIDIFGNQQYGLYEASYADATTNHLL